jgi:hypothetical protein
MARQGKTGQDKARQVKERQGKARQGKARKLFLPLKELMSGNGEYTPPPPYKDH